MDPANVPQVFLDYTLFIQEYASSIHGYGETNLTDGGCGYSLMKEASIFAKQNKERGVTAAGIRKASQVRHQNPCRRGVKMLTTQPRRVS